MSKVTIEDVLKKHLAHLGEMTIEFKDKNDCDKFERAIIKAMQEWASLQTPSNEKYGWVKASERLPEIDNKNPKHYIFLNDVNHQATNIYTGFIDSFPSMITNYLFDWKWLDESIEPCATSSWQLCPKCNGDGNLSRYNSPNLSTSTHPICDVCHGSKILATPSPTGDRDCELLPFEEGYVRKDGTGDRDCEELKKEVERLKGLCVEAFKAGDRFRKWIYHGNGQPPKPPDVNEFKKLNNL